MTERAIQDFFASGRSWYTFHGAACLLTIAIVAIPFSPLEQYLKTNIIYPFLFQSRDILGQTPPLSPRLKIFALDDSSFAFLGGPRLSPEDLTKMLINISERKPKAILIDGLLSEYQEDSEKWYKSLKQENLNVYTGVYLNNKPMRYRHALDRNKEFFRIESYLNPEIDVFDLELILDRQYDAHIYGPTQQLEDVFHGQGHIISNSDGTVSPFYRISSDIIIPHLSIFTADSVYIDRKELHINNHKVPINKKGRVTINYRPPQHLYKMTSPLHPLIRRARTGENETTVNQGDIVLILLSFASGHTDFHEVSPFGEIPGGMIIASMISSILESQWINSIDGSPFTILILAIIGTLLGIHASVSAFWIGVSLVISSYIFLAIYLFSYMSIEIPWLTPCLGFCSTGFLYFTHNRLQEEIKLVSIERNYYEEKSRRLEESAELAKLDGYLSLGKAVQNLLLPKNMSGTLSHFRYHLLYVPHLKMAGDWFYIWRVSRDETRFIMGDVMGKGPSAAITVASIISLLKDYETENISLVAALEKINARLIDLYSYHITCTVATATIFKDGTCKLINAGSPGWFLHSPQKTEFSMLRGTPLGLRDEIVMEEKTITMQTSQILFTVTDGYLEGSRSLRKLIRTLEQDKKTKVDLDYLTGILSSIQISENLEDDRSLIFLQYLG